MVQATNGADPSRRLAMLGFCRSVSDLSEVVEDAVLSCGGKIVLNQIELKRCRHPKALHASEFAGTGRDMASPKVGRCTAVMSMLLGATCCTCHLKYHGLLR